MDYLEDKVGDDNETRVQFQCWPVGVAAAGA